MSVSPLFLWRSVKESRLWLGGLLVVAGGSCMAQVTGFLFSAVVSHQAHCEAVLPCFLASLVGLK